EQAQRLPRDLVAAHRSLPFGTSMQATASKPVSPSWCESMIRPARSTETAAARAAAEAKGGAAAAMAHTYWITWIGNVLGAPGHLGVFRPAARDDATGAPPCGAWTSAIAPQLAELRASVADRRAEADSVSTLRRHRHCDQRRSCQIGGPPMPVPCAS